MDTEVYQLLVRELGADHPAVKALTRKRLGEFAETLQRNLGIHPSLIKLRQASKDYELGQASIQVRIRALQVCEGLDINEEFILEALEKGRRDARMARAIRQMT